MAEARIPQIGHTPEINQGAWPRLRIAADGSEGGRPRLLPPRRGRKIGEETSLGVRSGREPLCRLPAAGIRALVVHAKNDGARRLYERFDFLAFTDQPPTLYRLVKDLRRAALRPD